MEECNICIVFMRCYLMYKYSKNNICKLFGLRVQSFKNLFFVLISAKFWEVFWECEVSTNFWLYSGATSVSLLYSEAT